MDDVIFVGILSVIWGVSLHFTKPNGIGFVLLAIWFFISIGLWNVYKRRRGLKDGKRN